MSASTSGEFVSLTQIALVVLRRRWLIVKSCAYAVVLTAALVLMLGREYASEGRFVPDSGAGTAGALSGLAAQFGIAAALSGGGQTPDFYASLAKSRTVLGAVADSTFEFVTRTGALWWADSTTMRGRVAELYEIDRPKNRARERDESIELLEDLVSAGASLETGIISIRTQTDWPELSHAITSLVLRLISQYNLQTLQSRASEERRFVEERLESQRAELAFEEDSLRTFLEKNRMFSTAPQLVMEHDRLQRKVALRQQVVVGLAQAYEQSRIEEVRNTPVLTIVQEPEIPAKGVRRLLVVKVAAVAFITFAIVVGAAFLQDATERESRGGSSAELAATWRDARADVRRFLRFRSRLKDASS